MTARQIRRAQERKAAKLARKSQPASAPDATTRMTVVDAPSPFVSTEEPQSLESRSSEQRLAANRANAQLSTGPTSPEGKAKSSLNAVKTGLTGRTVLLSSDDAALYTEHCLRFAISFQPVGPEESALVQSLADTEWRLQRIPALEMAIYALGRSRFAERYETEDPALRPGLIELETYLAYEKQLRNLHLQESRLRRQREKDTAELHRLQAARKGREAEQVKQCSVESNSASAAAAKITAAALNGFDFSIPAMQQCPQLTTNMYKGERCALSTSF